MPGKADKGTAAGTEWRLGRGGGEGRREEGRPRSSPTGCTATHAGGGEKAKWMKAVRIQTRPGAGAERMAHTEGENCPGKQHKIPRRPSHHPQLLLHAPRWATGSPAPARTMLRQHCAASECPISALSMVASHPPAASCTSACRAPHGTEGGMHRPLDALAAGAGLAETAGVAVDQNHKKFW